MQCAALIVLIVRAGIVLMLWGLGLVGLGGCGHLCRVVMCVLMHDIDIDQRGHAPDLRDEEQAKQPWAEALKPSKHRPMPVREREQRGTLDCDAQVVNRSNAECFGIRDAVAVPQQIFRPQSLGLQIRRKKSRDLTKRLCGLRNKRVEILRVALPLEYLEARVDTRLTQLAMRADRMA